LVEGPKTQLTANEPHHVGMSLDQRWVIGAGLLSFLYGKDQLFIYEIDQDTLLPTFRYSIDVPGGCADEFVPLGGPTFLITMMCSKMAVSPGTVIFFNPETKAWYEWMKAPTIVDFNPHGCGWRDNYGLLTTDYVQPLTLVVPGAVTFRDTIRYFNVDGTLNATITPPSGVKNDGFMDIRWIPNDKLGRAMTGGTSDQGVYLVFPDKGTAKKVYDLRTLTHGISGLSSGYMPMSPDGLRIVMTYSMRYVTLCEIQNPDVPTTLDLFDFCNPPLGSGAPDFSVQCASTNDMVGSHFAVWHSDNRVFVVNYFLIFAKLNFGGTGTVHIFKVGGTNRNKLIYDVAFGSPTLPFDHPHSGKIGTWDKPFVPEPVIAPPPTSPASIIASSLWVIMVVFAVALF